MRHSWPAVLLLLVLIAGCDDKVTRRDYSAPAAPRGVSSVTGDATVYLRWLENTESDVEGYRVYEAACANGPDCPYDPIGVTTGSVFTVTGLANGDTRYFAVAAYDREGNESELSFDTVFDTPRPEGFDRFLDNYLDRPDFSGWDFSAQTARNWEDARTDMFMGHNGTVYQMFVPDFATDIQDAGYGSSLDAIDFAPTAGWSPTGSVELIEGHCYVVWTRDNNYAKFRVSHIFPATSGAAARVVFDWAYQVDPGNRELLVQGTRGEPGARRPIVWVTKPAS
ncbi:MAG: hypothetical protein HOP12_05635 [Candidatus Eisenbacteria bacterium]|uniref:Fibronectin type-III domain-containing protein n=1 Tax=Eiseniibacteriota bacterium TaxID=2212470 RepID=A0A849SLB9_UNCEI|nr:hypothetical protein [Candidatus Eisenbacteria bacterium]